MTRHRRPFAARARLTGGGLLAAASIGLGCATVAAGSAPAFAASGSTASRPALRAAALVSNVQRVAGPTRIGTAIATSQDEFATGGSARAVVLARADNFPDALAGGPLAAAKGGPLLLTPSNALDPTV